MNHLIDDNFFIIIEDRFIKISFFQGIYANLVI